jgi:hypothetical protein
MILAKRFVKRKIALRIKLEEKKKKELARNF